MTQAPPPEPGPDDDPLALLARWADEASAGAAGTPTTMVLATADGDGAPHARTVVVTAVTGAGLRFHSSTPTTKTEDLAVNPRASGVLHWPARGRQVVVTGTARRLPAEVSGAAYPTRPRQLQLLAWAYEHLARRPVGPDGEQPVGAVEAAVAAAAQGDPSTLPVPASWTTFELRPHRVDVWRAGREPGPPSRTRFVRAGGQDEGRNGSPGDGPLDVRGGGWRRFPVLP